MSLDKIQRSESACKQTSTESTQKGRKKQLESEYGGDRDHLHSSFLGSKGRRSEDESGGGRGQER